MKCVRSILLVAFLVCLGGSIAAQKTKPTAPREDLLVTHEIVGHYGGRLVVAQWSEPKTLNPVFAVDQPSRNVLDLMNADLIHINRQTLCTEPALAKSWTVSRDGKVYMLYLRRGIRFSDGQPFSADDVVFSFRVYLDQTIHSPQRDLLVVGGQPIAVRKLNPYTVRFRLAQPYAAAERLFDSVAILPKHLLEKPYREGNLMQAWPLTVPPDRIAGLGPFRLKKYVPGQEITLERNPYYWKEDSKGNRLPYLNEVTFLDVPSEDAEAIRFQAGDTDVISDLSAENFALLSRDRDQKARRYVLQDLGPGLEYNFLLFNMNDDTASRFPEIARKQRWFRDVRFRKAVSAAIDRDGIVRLVYQGRATPLWEPETPGDKLWVDSQLPHPPQSLARARNLLRAAGFFWKSDGRLFDASSKPVEFSILVSSSNSVRTQIANIIQQDLQKLGMNVHIVPLDFGTFVQRILRTHEYDAAVMGLVSGDADPNPAMSVLLSSGPLHLWHLGEKQPATPWEAEIDKLMEQQLTTVDYKTRKRLYNRVQEIMAEQLPIICLVSPDILVGRKRGLGNFRPGILEPYTTDNAEDLFWKEK